MDGDGCAAASVSVASETGRLKPCHAKIGPPQNWSGGPILAGKIWSPQTTFSYQN